MTDLLSTFDKPIVPLVTPPPTSNPLNLQFHFERSPSKPSSFLDLDDEQSPDENQGVSMTASSIPGVGVSEMRPASRPQHQRRPSTAPESERGLTLPSRITSSHSALPGGSSGPNKYRTRIGGKLYSETATHHHARPATAPSGDWRFGGQSASSSTAPQIPSPPTSLSQAHLPRQREVGSADLGLSDSSHDMLNSSNTRYQSARAGGLTRSLVSPTAAELSAITVVQRPPYARRMSVLSLGGELPHTASGGSSMDFGKFMPQTSTTSPRSASFTNSLSKNTSPVDVKRLLTKPATPVGSHPAGGFGRADDTSGNVLASPPAPQFASEAPSSPRSDEIQAGQPFQLDSTLKSPEVRARPRTAGDTTEKRLTVVRSSPEIAPRPSTAAPAIQGDRGRANALATPLHTYSSGGEGIGESPQQKQKFKRASSSRPKARNRASAFVKTDGYLSESSVRLPKVTTALTPAAAIALAYRSQSSARRYHREGRTTPDPKVAPWESDPDLPIPLPTPAPSEWGDLCTPTGFRKLGRKISTKLSGDEQPPMPARAGARPRTRSFDRPKPRDLPRKASFEGKRPSRPTTAATNEFKSHTKPAAAADAGLETEHKRRPSFGQHLHGFGFLKKLSNPNLRSRASEAPPVPPLPTTVKEKTQLETPRGKGERVPPVPAIPIHLTKLSTGSENDCTGEGSVGPSASSSVYSFEPSPRSAATAPGTTPPHTTERPQARKAGEAEDSSELPYTIDLPSPNTGRAKRKPSTHELRDPPASKKPDSNFPSAPATPEEERQARRRTLSKAATKRDKAGKLMISISEPTGLQNITLLRTPSAGATVSSSASKERPSLASMPRTKSDGDVHVPGNATARKPQYTVAQAFPPPRSASLNTPSPSATSRPNVSPLSASSPAGGVAFRQMRSSSSKAPLSEKQKAALWDELLRRSDEAGGTLQLHAMDKDRR